MLMMIMMIMVWLIITQLNVEYDNYILYIYHIPSEQCCNYFFQKRGIHPFTSTSPKTTFWWIRPWNRTGFITGKVTFWRTIKVVSMWKTTAFTKKTSSVKLFSKNITSQWWAYLLAASGSVPASCQDGSPGDALKAPHPRPPGPP